MSVLIACILTLACGGGITGPASEGDGASPAVSDVEVTPSAVDVRVEGTASLTVEVLTSDGEPLDRSGDWTVRDASIVEVEGSGSERQVRGLKAGSTRVVATVDGVADSAHVEVTSSEGGSDGGSDVASVETTPSSVTLEPGATAEVSVEATASDGSSLDRSGTWEIEDATVASVSGDGPTRLVEGEAAGSTRLIVSVAGVADTTSVEVTSSVLDVASVETTPSSVTLEPGATAEVSVEATASDGSSLDRSGTWEIEDATVASVSGDGPTRLVEGEAAGSTRLIVSVAGVADTTSVEVLSSTTPADAEPVFADDFDGGLASGQNGFAWGNSVNMTVAADAARTGSSGLRLSHPAKADGEDSVAQVNLRFGQQVQEVWVEYWMKVPDNYRHRDSSGTDNNKFFQLWSGPRSEPNVHMFTELETSRAGAAGDSRHVVKVANQTSGDEIIWGRGQNLMDPFVRASDAGRWVHLQYEVQLGTAPDGWDAVVRIWKDGELVFAPPYEERGGTIRDGLNLRSASAGTNVLDRMRLLGWSNSGYDEPTAFDFDELRVYTRDPGW